MLNGEQLLYDMAINASAMSTEYSDDDFVEAIRSEGGSADTRTVASTVGCSKDTALIRLGDLADAETIGRQKWGNSYVWTVSENV